MASSRPGSDPLLMFGYSVDTSQENLFDGAPEHAPGAPLLTETDSKVLSCFFQDMTSNQYNMPSFGEGLNFSDAWLDLPPQFMGSSTSFGSQEDPTAGDFGFSHDQQNDVSRMLSTGSSMMPPPPPPPPPPAIAPSLHPTPFLSQTQTQTFQPSQHQQHSDDVLNAAATLLRNGSRARNGQSLGNSSKNGSNRDSESNDRRSSAPFSIGHLQHQPMEEFKEQTRRSSQVAETEHSLTGWMFGSKQQKVTHPEPAVGDIQWGSDARFTDVQGYVPEPAVESVEAMHQQQMKFLDSLAIEKSAANPRPSSAVNNKGTRDASSNGNGHTHTTREEELNGPPRKRRKSRNVPRSTIEEEYAGDDDDAASTKSFRKRKTRPERSVSGSEPPPDATAITAGGPRRRKSGTAAAATAAVKPPRENLSEEQKRENHIRSEQKRRTLIKQGFDDLGVLVPGLRGGGFSKSTTLTMAADWLEQLLQENKALALQAEALERR
ncbi:hypothetical protein E4U17_005558 [Claviceps sp. LM77 group G4]|nr:hypothetical protein E4U17_005558 [Claviceps sp. LM77 group G4]KAG6061545.1 hypothetical protein E4U33_006662 [Claviceps sp. LM78 group G4]KAG6074415.1 hypothetical protein E4U16_003947 [Claviceps sp. LM84 group G4]